MPATMPGEGSQAIPALWARETIEDLELNLACGGVRKDVDQRIEQIALEYSILSRLTSWVAIAEEPSVDPREPIRIERIPQALPYGMSPEGLGLGAENAVPQSRQRPRSHNQNPDAARNAGARQAAGRLLGGHHSLARL